MIGRVWTGALVFAVALLPTVARGQSPQSGATARAVDQLEALNARVVEAAGAVAPGSGPAPGSELNTIAEARLQLLLTLVESAPSEVLRLALPGAVRDSLPAAARALTEERVDLTGTVEVSYEDHPGFSRLRHVLDTGSARYTLHVAGDAPGWTSGEQIRVRGVRVQDLLALDGSSASTSASATALAGASGEQRTLMILVNFRNNLVQPYTTAYAHDLVFGTTDGYYREASAGATWLAGEVLGWFTIDMDDTVCDTTTLATLARQAATDAGASLSLYSRFVYAFPSNACAWWGLGSVGGNPSQAWINGDLALDVAGHELGHNVGLYHSKNMDCGATPIGSACTVSEYGDTLDLMGATNGHFNAFQKERLGWLAPGQIVTVGGSGTYSIEPFETITGGVKVLKILKSMDPTTGKRTFYYVEFRRPIGYDGFMSAWTNVVSGVSIHTGSEASGNSAYLLDMTPETASWYDPALTAGRTFSDSAAGLTLTLLSASSSGAAVSVTLDAVPPTCTPALPGVTLSPGAPTAVAPGTMVVYTVTIANNDSPGCATPTFALSRTVPANWIGTFDASSLSPAPGTTASTMLRVTAATTATGGVYNVSVSAVDAADATHAGSGSATYSVVVPTPVSLAVATDRASYTRGSKVVVSATVMAGSTPVGGASVAFRIQKADGKIVNGSGTTNASGVATYQLQLRKGDPRGTYQATATTSAGASATASTTFSVN